LTGLHFSFAADGNLPAFRDASGYVPVAFVDGQPYVLRQADTGGQRFLFAEQRIPDMDAPVASEEALRQALAGLLPILVVLRHVFPDRVWRSDQARACVILDDPLLRPRYGFLDHRRLLAELDRLGAAATLAFIPWNFDRSEENTAKLYASRSDRLSLCVHGCDHTQLEFGSLNEKLLRDKAQLALARMVEHQCRFGVSFDPIMVFPQGVFSDAALEALAATGYEAAVNSTLFPAADSLSRPSLRNLLDVAVTRPNSVPLFRRNYPSDRFETALSLFLGRPVLMVEHHKYFKEGYGALESSVEAIRRLEPGIQWLPLGDLISRACKVRCLGPEEYQVRFYVPHFRFTSQGYQANTFHFAAVGADARKVERVSVNGKLVEFRVEDGNVCFDASVPPGTTATIELSSSARHVGSADSRRTCKGGLPVYTRRYLSEFQDNWLARSTVAIRCVEVVRRWLRS
jgi:hypothetical protein